MCDYVVIRVQRLHTQVELSDVVTGSVVQITVVNTINDQSDVYLNLGHVS